MDNQLYTDIKQALWIALIEDGKIIESGNCFALHFNEVKSNGFKFFQNKNKETELLNMCKVYVDRLIQKGHEYFSKEDWAKTIICYEIAQNYNTLILDNVQIARNFLMCLARTKQTNIIYKFVEHYKKITNNNINEFKYLAEIFHITNDNENSIKYMEDYINSKNPDEITADEYNLLGFYYNFSYSNGTKDISLLQNALKYFELSYSKNPQNRLYIKNILIITSLLNDKESCKYYWDKLFDIGPINEDERFEYSAYCLKNGNFDGWYDNYDSRFKRSNPILFPNIDAPLCNRNIDITGKTLLIYYEQGFGDTVLMWGYNKYLLNKKAKLIWVVQDNIYPLLKNSTDEIEVYPAGTTDLNKLQFDYYIPSMDIPKFLNITKENASVGSDYIYVQPEKIKHFKDLYFKNNKLKIGIAFSGNENGNQTRNIPIETFELLNNLKDIEIYSLVKNADDSLFKNFKDNNIVNIAKCFDNFENTAAVMKNLDLIITGDNIILNLAGALGIKTYAMFNWCYEFRWYNLNNENVGWYTTVKPFINEKMDDWNNSMKKIIKEIAGTL